MQITKPIIPILLPTEKASRLHITKESILRLWSNSLNAIAALDAIGASNKFLYITLPYNKDDESTWIKEGDWYYFSQLKTILHNIDDGEGLMDFTELGGRLKIIATNDKSLNLPDAAPDWITKSFIPAFNEKREVKWEVVYEDEYTFSSKFTEKEVNELQLWIPKTDSNNCIEIREVESL